MKPRFAIYSRKSKFTGKGESIENQVEMCKQYIRLHFGDSFANESIIYEDEGFSGGTLDRPQFIQMMKDASSSLFTSIVVYRLDRISRNIGDFAKLIEGLNEMNIEFISIKEQFDTSSPMGRAMMYISSVFSQLERETIAERIRDNLHELAKSGRWLGGITPTGYKSVGVTQVSIDGRARKACHLELINSEALVIKHIYQKFLETKSLTQTESWLIQNSFLTKNGKHFTRFSVRNILTNPVYTVADESVYNYLTLLGVNLFSEKSEFDGLHGVMTYNRTLQRRGKTNQIRPHNEWICAVGKHQGIISGKDWVSVQNILEANRSKGYRKPRSHTALLSGLLVCENCGSFMRPKQDKSRLTYICSTKERSKGTLCSVKNCNGLELESRILETIKSFVGSDSEFIKQIELAKANLLKNSGVEIDEIGTLESEINSKKSEIKSLVTTLSKPTAVGLEDHLLSQIAELNTQIEALSTRLEGLKELSSRTELSNLEFDLLVDSLTSFSSTVDQMNLEQKRFAIRTIVEKILWNGDSAEIFLSNSVPHGKDRKSYLRTAAQICTKVSKNVTLYSVPVGNEFKQIPRFSDKIFMSDPLPATPPPSLDLSQKLKWYRQKHGLLQKEVASKLGLTKNQYHGYESGKRNQCPLEVARGLSKLYSVPVVEFSDPYNQFLLSQRKRLISIRKRLHLTQKEFAHLVGISRSALQNWEKEKVTVSKSSWAKIVEIEKENMI